MTAPTEHRVTTALVLVDDLSVKDMGVVFLTRDAHSDVFCLDLNAAHELGTNLLAAVDELRRREWDDVWKEPTDG
jgi:hypothetical protein